MKTNESLHFQATELRERIQVKQRSITNSNLSAEEKEKQLLRIRPHLEFMQEIESILFIDYWRKCELTLVKMMDADPSLSCVIFQLRLRPGDHTGKIEFNFSDHE